ncbi:unnamed protein product [Schistosoma curassoni]|uniref:Sperm microtubule inner protein 1 C-terminal domain-containing protein n=1 Tax=Schistosoma curassoni TaxID=6186 RepID=A0A183KDV7_9TREM|nr:unnamed protein product [Schistosoma curassoni]
MPLNASTWFINLFYHLKIILVNLYLHDRYKLNLEDKFQFPVLSSMEYGWGHADLISKSTAQSRKFGRQCVIEDSFYRRTGIPFKHGAGMIGLDKYSF